MAARLSMRNMLNCCNPPAQFAPSNASSNDSTITKSQRYSQYVRNTAPGKHYEDTAVYLENRGLTFTPFYKQETVRTTTEIKNGIIFPRERIFISVILRP